MNIMMCTLLRPVRISAQTSINRTLQSSSSMNHTVTGTVPCSTDMLRVWGVLGQNGKQLEMSGSSPTIKGTTHLEILRKRLLNEPCLFERQPVYGDFMVAQVPPSFKPIPADLPISMKKKMLRKVTTKRFGTRVDRLMQFESAI